MTISPPYLLLILVFTGLITGTLVLAAMDENDWIAAQTPNHPPSVEVVRAGQTVQVRWYGGWTDPFITDLRVCVDGVTCRDYPKPRPGTWITFDRSVPTTPGSALVDVFVYDQATHHWFNIKTAEV